MISIRIVTAALAAVLVVTPAIAQGTKVAIGISGWTGFAPIVFAKETDIFSKNGLDVSIKKILRIKYILQQNLGRLVYSEDKSQDPRDDVRDLSLKK